MEAYPNLKSRTAAVGRPAVAAQIRAQERTRWVRQAFHQWNASQTKFLLTQPDDTRIDLCADAASRLIVDGFYPEDDNTAFNELRGSSSEDFFTGIKKTH